MVYTTADDASADGFTRSERIRRLKRLSRLARVMDTAIRVPGIGVRFGVDSVMGLIPGVGDAAGGLVGLFIINEARKLGLPRHKIMRMVANVGIDVAVGSVPLLGDVFDVYFKAHKRNTNMILDHFPDHRADLDPDLLKDITPKR